MSNNTIITQILIKRGNTETISTYTGPHGELIFNTDDNSVYVQDGVTQGGHQIGPNVSTLNNTLANLQTEVGNIAGITGNVIQLEQYFANVNLHAIDSNVTTLISNVTSIQSLISGNVGNVSIDAGNLFLTTTPDGSGNLNSWVSTTNNNTGIYISPSNTNQFAELFLPADANSTENGYVGASGTGGFTVYGYNAQYTVNLVDNVNIVANSSQWIFDGSGNLTMPTASSKILFPYNTNSNAIIDYSQDIGQFFILQNNFADGYQAINLDTNDALVQISSKNAGGYPLRTWSFDWQGQLTFPDATIQSTAYQGPAGQTSFATVANVTTANVALKAYVDNKIGLLANAPAILDTLGQIATAIQTDEANIGTLLTNLTTTNANIIAANAAIITANTAMKGYVDAVTTAWTANAATQLSQITAANSAISTLQANLGSYYFWNNANAVGLYNSITSANTSIQTISANIGSFYTYANLNYGTSSYANANVTGYLAGNITIGNATATSFRSNNFLYANGVSILTGIGGTYSNSNVASYLLGNITTGNVGLSIGSWLDFRTTDQNWRIGYGLGAYTKTTAQTTIDVVVGQGQAGPDGFSVGQTGGTSIFELVGYTKNAWFANNVTVVGNVTSGNVLASGFFYANGTPFTSSSYGNTQVAAYLVANPQSGTYSNTNVSAYLTSATITTTGSITASNIVTTGALQGGSGTQGIALQPWTGGGSYAALYSTAITPANGNYSILVNGTSTWLNAGSGGSLFFRINNQTAPTAFTINASQATIGSIGTANSSAVNTQTLVVAGGGLGVTGSSYFSNTLGVGGNLILSNTSYVTSTTGSNGNITLDPDGTGQVSVVGSLTATGNITAGNLTTSGTYTVANITTTGAYGNITGANVISANTISATNFVYSANGVSILSGIGGTYSNTNVAAYLTTQTFYSNSNVASYLVANPQGSTYSNANVVANLSNYVTNIVSTANITANYFIGNGAALTGLTYNQIGNIYGSSSNVTLQAGSYSWTFDNTGNLTIPTTSNIVYANGAVFTSGSGGGGSGTYSNANVVSMLSANSIVVVGNVNPYPTQSNITQLFVGGNTIITSGGGTSAGATEILNNAYWNNAGVLTARNTYSNGAMQIIIDGGSLTVNAQGSATANTATGMGSRLTLTSTALSTVNSIGITSAGTLTVQGAGGIVTSQTSFPLVNTTATSVQFAGASATTTIGASNGITVFGANTGAISAGTIIVNTNFITNGNVTANAGGSIVSTGNSYTTGNTYTQYLVTTGNSLGNISGVNNLTAVTIQTTGTYGNITGANVISSNSYVSSGNVTVGGALLVNGTGSNVIVKTGGIVSQNVVVAMDNIRVQWYNLNGGGSNNALQMASQSGTPSVLMTYIYQSGLGGSPAGGVTSLSSLSTTFANVFASASGVSGDTYTITGTVGSNAYRITAMTGQGYSNNILTIERLA